MATSSSNEGPNSSYFDHFTCNICFGVLREPVQCARNEHYFCISCITQHLTRSQTCPVCQDHPTSRSLRPISGVVANLLQQFQSPRCRYANRGCTASVRREVLLSHHEECGFAPVQCSNDGCEETVNRQDLARHERESCDFRPVACEECKQRLSQKEYGRHPCYLLKEIDKNKLGLGELQKILREIQEEQLRLRQSVEMCLLTQGLEQLNTTPRRQERDLRSQGGVVSLPNTTQGQQRHDGSVATLSSQVQIQPAVRDRQFIVAGGIGKSYEVFNWSKQQWTLYENALFFDHTNGFSFVYDNKIMVCGGTDTNKVECLDMTYPTSPSVLPMSLPSTDCGKGVLYAGKILTFADWVLATYLKPPYGAKYQLFCMDRGQTKLSSYGVACVNENAVAIVGGYKILSNNSSELTDTVRVYDPNTKQLKQLAPLPDKVADMAVLAYNDDNVIILGGETEYGVITNDVLIYNIKSQQCSKLPSMLKKRTQCAAVIIGDTIIAVGGSYRLKSLVMPHITAEYLVLGENTWKELPETHWSRVGATACALP